ncbi:STAS domain-containing protein [Jannaschia sp. S6380]|uniref:STAS domain-containing protein n=1 Tax=Jannaschia sp. S6380 TaxID=2926408 RepID=UPI001FF149DA|nr:STAS domain-containing protein [Jannaschia sp. S6380]MCK0168897.1 STAS domain-containing protein [Jannaschia sp. S6380]
MKIDSEIRGDVLLLTLGDPRVDAAVAMVFKERVRTLIQGFDGRVMIDMSRVEFLDSSGLGALVAVMKLLDNDRRLELAGCGPIVRKVLTLTRMDSVFVLHDAPPAGSDLDAA